MNPERLDVKQPESHAKHGDDGPVEESSGERVSETRESGETKHTEISERAQTADGNATDLGISAAKNLEAIGRAATNGGFTRQKHHREIGRFG